MYKRNIFGTKNMERVDYSGMVYCVEVPNHIIYVRRSGYSMWSGNSTRGKYFSFKWLKPHQRQALLDVEKCGGFGYILFSKRGKPVEGRAIRIHEYIDLEEKFKEKGRKSINVSAMIEAGIKLPRVRGRFDISPIFLNRNNLTKRQTKLK